eukprot:CAMPEP_0196244654 /NCGR_PEP_ID=MMETSP0913-20130531/31233_1 /TAXON_ID=49265 /ORGANISM="Thalassiosira rotula, Strain GSO102" /LENGTH=79 /DNA_ID=CAMNT_0041528663 /DNA_START=75 /DNA_END=310 /DNA_ORIENTATION=+
MKGVEKVVTRVVMAMLVKDLIKVKRVGDNTKREKKMQLKGAPNVRREAKAAPKAAAGAKAVSVKEDLRMKKKMMQLEVT